MLTLVTFEEMNKISFSSIKFIKKIIYICIYIYIYIYIYSVCVHFVQLPLDQQFELEVFPCKRLKLTLLCNFGFQAEVCVTPVIKLVRKITVKE